MSVTWDPKAYAAYRPRYPHELYTAILEAGGPSLGRELAVDVGCGSGQVSVDLAPLFTQVIGIDTSETQLAAAFQAPNVEYRLGTSEATGLPSNCANLVTAAAALHWFSLEEFFIEARRILHPTGILAAWSYNKRPHFGDNKPAAAEAYEKLIETILMPYFDPRLWSIVQSQSYDDFLPSSEHFGAVEQLYITQERISTVDMVVGMVKSMSPFNSLATAKGQSAADALLEEFAREFEAGMGVASRQEEFPVVWTYDLILAKDPKPLESSLDAYKNK